MCPAKRYSLNASPGSSFAYLQTELILKITQEFSDKTSLYMGERSQAHFCI